MLPYAYSKLFDDQLTFTLPDGTETSDPVSVGNTPFVPQILSEYPTSYESEYSTWLNDIWKPRQRDNLSVILDYGNNRDRFFDLGEAVQQEYVAPIVGSGMCVTSGLPMWSQFLLDVGESIDVETSTLNQMIEAERFEDAANFLADTSHFRLFNERIEHDLRVIEPKMIDGPILLLPQLFGKLMITTNFDNVLQDLYAISDATFDWVLTGQQLDRYHELQDSTESVLLKLHGDRQDESDRVLLSHEYETAYGAGGVVSGLLSTFIRNHNILFMGCSLTTDRTMDLMHAIAGPNRKLPKHFAFLPLSDEAGQKNIRENWLAERGIYPIWYDTAQFDHDEALFALLEGLHGE